MERRYPCLFECRDGSTYLVLEDPCKCEVEAAIHVVLRLDGEPTRFFDTSKVFFTITMEQLEGLPCAWRDY